MQPGVQVLVGLCCADFLTAFFHFFEDTYMPYTDKQTILGSVARDNEMHHYVPYSITSSTWRELVKIPLLLSMMVVCAVYIIAPRWSSHHTLLLATAFCVGTLSNVLHKYQHERDCTRPGWITSLMSMGLLVSRDEHKDHHREPTTRYGIITSVGNRVYDGLGIWNVFERIIPLKRYPKPGIDAYSDDIPKSVKTLTEEECPRHLTQKEIGALHVRLHERNKIMYAT